MQSAAAAAVFTVRKEAALIAKKDLCVNLIRQFKREISELRLNPPHSPMSAFGICGGRWPSYRGVCQEISFLTKTSVASKWLGLQTNMTTLWKDETLTNTMLFSV
jgi:predicted HNH restriction endonuclease